MPPPGVCANIIEKRHKQDGKGSLANPSRFLDQDYQQLKQYCLVRKGRYIDELFPPEESSIGQGVLSPSDMTRVVWLRPAKMVLNPFFIVEGISRFDFGQGSKLGNCWFLAAIGALTFQNDILQQVVPVEQTFNEPYCGLFHFRFWRFGVWVDVVIDDKLPTIDGKLIFVHSTTPSEFWPALLEKAYAKVCGSYADMNAGTTTEAMVDFTGGIHMCIQLATHPKDLWQHIFRAAKSKSLMGCATPWGETSANTVATNGVVQGHAYTVTGVTQMKSNGKLVSLLRLWNPWGEGEWNGDWSDRSLLWQTVSAQEREECLIVANDGEFWMAIEDVCRFYSELDICSLSPYFLDGNASSHWITSIHDGRWVGGTTAGGCLNYIDSFWTNPQYRIKIEGVANSEEQGETNILVSLMQKPNKRNRRLVNNLHIGITIFEYKKERGKFPVSFFKTHNPVAQTKNLMNSRSVMEFFKLKPGEYLIVPSTYKPKETASFILTVHSRAETHVHENSSDYNTEIQVQSIETELGSVTIGSDDVNRFLQYSDKHEEVDAEQLQRLLNDNILQGHLKAGGFTLDACRSMVALMDSSITGRLNHLEFSRLWKKVTQYKEIFFLSDVSRSGTLSLSELRNAIMATGLRVSDDMLNLMALRYGATGGHITLESFISLVLRMNRMADIYRQLSDGKSMLLHESEWMYVSMYT